MSVHSLPPVKAPHPDDQADLNVDKAEKSANAGQPTLANAYATLAVAAELRALRDGLAEILSAVGALVDAVAER